MLLFPLLHGKIKFIDLKKETVEPSLCHSYRSPFKGQVIALPSHGQNTAAVEYVITGQAGPLILGLQEAMFLVNRRGSCYVCRVPSLSFSLSLVALLCWVNGILLGGFLVLYYVSQCLLCGRAVNIQRTIRSDLHACRERGTNSLITHISMVSPMLAWGGPVGLGG